MIVDTGEEPFGFPLACFLGGADTVVGGAAPVQDELAGSDVRRLIASVPHGLAPLSVLREAALERMRDVPLSDLDAATATGLTTWSTAAPSSLPNPARRPRCSGTAEGSLSNTSPLTATAPVRYRERPVALAEGESGLEMRPVLALPAAMPDTQPQLAVESTASPQAGGDPAAVALERRFEATECPSDNVPAEEAIPSEPVDLCDARDPITYLLGAAALTGDDVSKAEPSYAADRGWSVLVSFIAVGGRKFAQLTTRLATLAPPQNQLAITAEGRVVSAPSVIQTLTGGTMEISGSFDKG